MRFVISSTLLSCTSSSHLSSLISHLSSLISHLSSLISHLFFRPLSPSLFRPAPMASSFLSFYLFPLIFSTCLFCSCALRPSPCALRPTPYALRPTPFALRPSPCYSLTSIRDTSGKSFLQDIALRNQASTYEWCL